MRRYAISDDPNSEFLSSAVSLHREALSDRSFVTMLGQSFLVELYRRVLARRAAFLVLAHEHGRLDGFILASKDSDQLMRTVLSGSHAFILRMVPALVRHPGLIARLWQTLRYSKNQGTHVKAELVAIAVAPERRSRGIGRQMLSMLEWEFARQGVTEYKVAVHQEMEESNRFYLQNGMRLHNVFDMYDVSWNTYLKEIGPTTRRPEGADSWVRRGDDGPAA